MTRFCLCPSRVRFTSPVVPFWWSYGVANGDLLQEGLCHTQVCSTQSPCGWPLLTHTSTGDTQTQFDSISVCWACLCALPRSEQLRRPGAWRMHYPRWAACLNHLPGPGCSVFWVCFKSTISRVLCVSSGELISACEPPGGCQPSRISGRRS